jgi:crotonobetaine/carnitine-CoA ligase
LDADNQRMTSDAAPSTIPELVAAAAEREGGRTWLRTDGARLTFAATAGWAAQSAARLRDTGVERGDLVLMTARNTPEYLAALLGVWWLGAIAVPVNPGGAAAELEGLLAQARPRLVVSDPAMQQTLDAAGVGRDPDRASIDVADATGPAPASADAEPPRLQAEDVAVLIPTSGTTGRSKLVIQTHRAYVMAGEGFPFWMELSADDVLMTSLPLFHINAPAYSIMGSLSIGAGFVLLPRFSPGTFVDDARRHGATEFNAIGAMLEMLMRQPERVDDARSSLRLCYAGPAPARERHEEIERRFGLRIVCGYGLSESTYGLIWTKGTRPFGALGSPRQHPRLGEVNSARVVDESGHDVAPGTTGELLLRNPAVTPGYWEMPEETASTVRDGWLHTGDLVTEEPEGVYTFVARRKEVIRRRGENLSPLEVEEAIEAHPAVLECAVVGIPSELSEEDVKAFVVAVGGMRLELDEVRDFAATRLSAFKVPRFWEALDALPRTPTGRVARHQLPAPHGSAEIDLGERRRVTPASRRPR